LSSRGLGWGCLAVAPEGAVDEVDQELLVQEGAGSLRSAGDSVRVTSRAPVAETR
jgi:hypothetical protein